MIKHIKPASFVKALFAFIWTHFGTEKRCALTDWVHPANIRFCKRFHEQGSMRSFQHHKGLFV